MPIPPLVPSTRFGPDVRDPDTRSDLSATKRAGGVAPPAGYSPGRLLPQPDAVEEGGAVLEEAQILDLGVEHVALLDAGVHERRLLVGPDLLEGAIGGLPGVEVEAGAPGVEGGVDLGVGIAVEVRRHARAERRVEVGLWVEGQ